MAKPITFDGETHREMTDAEYAAYVQWQNDLATEQAERDAAEAAKKAAQTSARTKLAALGLNDNEIAALLGAL